MGKTSIVPTLFSMTATWRHVATDFEMQCTKELFSLECVKHRVFRSSLTFLLIHIDWIAQKFLHWNFGSTSPKVDTQKTY